MDPVAVAVLSVLGSKSGRTVVAAAQRWLAQQAPRLAPAVREISDAGSEVVQAFGEWLAYKLDDEIKSTNLPQTVRSVSLSQGAKLLTTLSAAEEISGNALAQSIAPEPDNVQELANVPIDDWVGLGRQRAGKTFEPVLVLHDASRHTKELRERYPGVKSIAVGHISSREVSETRKLIVEENDHRPGRSVAHWTSFAGSLGLYVMYGDADLNRELPGFVSAAHVLTNMGSAKKGENNSIRSPGFPDRERMGIYHYGELVNWRDLVHYSDPRDRLIVDNNVDIAVASLYKDNIAARNVVPDPGDGAKLLDVVEVLSLESAMDKVGGTVHKIGRTTGRTSGLLRLTDIARYPIEMPNGKHYMYSGLMAIEGGGGERFSDHGDSGGLIYIVENGQAKALGFVVGGNDKFTLAFPASSSLEAVGARLL